MIQHDIHVVTLMFWWQTSCFPCIVFWNITLESYQLYICNEFYFDDRYWESNTCILYQTDFFSSFTNVIFNIFHKHLTMQFLKTLFKTFKHIQHWNKHCNNKQYQLVPWTSKDNEHLSLKKSSKFYICQIHVFPRYQIRILTETELTFLLGCILQDEWGTIN